MVRWKVRKVKMLGETSSDGQVGVESRELRESGRGAWFICQCCKYVEII